MKHAQNNLNQPHYHAIGQLLEKSTKLNKQFEQNEKDIEQHTKLLNKQTKNFETKENELFSFIKKYDQLSAQLKNKILKLKGDAVNVHSLKNKFIQKETEFKQKLSKIQAGLKKLESNIKKQQQKLNALIIYNNNVSQEIENLDKLILKTKQAMQNQSASKAIQKTAENPPKQPKPKAKKKSILDHFRRPKAKITPQKAPRTTVSKEQPKISTKPVVKPRRKKNLYQQKDEALRAQEKLVRKTTSKTFRA